MAGAQDSEQDDLTEAADPAQPEQKGAKTLTGFFSVYEPNNAGRTLTSLLWHSSHLPRNAWTFVVYSLPVRQNWGASDGTRPKFRQFWVPTDGTLTNLCILYGSAEDVPVLFRT
jgi:hypothetical protein